eukprot:scaffold7215_cov366-Prasinococcus_capsulatus_cf.AAC.3
MDGSGTTATVMTLSHGGPQSAMESISHVKGLRNALPGSHCKVEPCDQCLSQVSGATDHETLLSCLRATRRDKQLDAAAAFVRRYAAQACDAAALPRIDLATELALHAAVTPSYT